LILLNEQAAKNVERISLKSVMRGKKAREGSNAGEVRGKEGENNTAVIGRLRM
jgi:hypothetical protein